MASNLTIGLIGIGMGAMVFGAHHYLRGSQATSVSSQSVTVAQMRAWTAAEEVRQFLLQAGATESATLAGDITFAQDFSGVSGRIISAQASAPECGGATRVQATVTAVAEATATLDLLYCVSSAGGSGGRFTPTVNIKGNLTMTGDIRAVGGQSARIVVDGNVTDQGSITGFDSLYATGKITLSGSNTSMGNLFSESDIELSGSGTYNTIQALGNFTITGGTSTALLAQVNGSTTYRGGTVQVTQSIGDVTVSAGGLRLPTVATKGSFRGAGTTVTSLRAEGSYSDSSPTSGDTKVSDGIIRTAPPGWSGGAIYPNNPGVRVQVDPALRVPLVPLTASSLGTQRIDAELLRSYANYLFDLDAQGRAVVTVKSVAGITDGTYFLVSSGDKQDYLCSAATYSANGCVAKICNGQSLYNSCFTFSRQANGLPRWTVAGPEVSGGRGSTLAPGIVWFSGDVVWGQGTFFNSVLVSSNLQTGANNVTSAVNHAGYQAVCANQSFPGLTPSQLCDLGRQVMKASQVGNIGMLAGSYRNGVTFVGGVIDLTANITVNGSILAGDVLRTGGSTVVRGFITTAGQGGGNNANALSASTTLDMSNLPAGYDPGNTDPGQGGTGAGSARAVIRFSRYL